jgi:transposase
MGTGVTVYLSPTDRKRLQAIVDDRNSPQKHVWRARIVLATADGLGTATIMRTAGVSKTAVWRWQERFMSEGVDGLLRDKTRPARIARLTDDVAERIGALTLGEPPGETTHWTGRVMAKAAGVSLTSVQRIWRAHGLARTGSAPSSFPTIRSSPPRSATSSACMSIRPPTPWSSVSMRSPRSRPWTAPSRACP